MSRTKRKDFYETSGKWTRDKKKWYKPGKITKLKQSRKDKAIVQDLIRHDEFDIIPDFPNRNTSDFN